MHIRIIAGWDPPLVERADVLADVTSGDPGPHGFGHGGRQFWIAVFKSVKSDAAPCIHHKRFCNRTGWTGFDTGAALTAPCFGWLIGLELFCGDQMTDHHP